MEELIATNDIVTISVVQSLLSEAKIEHLLLDQNMSILEGSIGIIPRRIMVERSKAQEARELLKEAGYDPDNLGDDNKHTMDFAKRDQGEAKAWKDIWSAGQGVGTIDDIPTTEALVARMAEEYDAARQALSRATAIR